jgi:betaine-homocysteine S-methyltransferase
MGLMERLASGPVICAEGYLFEFERRGYLQAGAFVPEVVLEHPDLVEELHREFVHAGSDVVEAFTYYAHREKLRVIGREGDLEKINRKALDVAKKVAKDTGTLVAGNICNTGVFTMSDPASAKETRRQFDEQLGWAVDAGVDYLIGETYSYASEALVAVEAMKATNSRPRSCWRSTRSTRRARAGTSRTPARSSRMRAPTSSVSTAPAGRRRCCRSSKRSCRR